MSFMSIDMPGKLKETYWEQADVAKELLGKWGVNTQGEHLTMSNGGHPVVDGKVVEGISVEPSTQK